MKYKKDLSSKLLLIIELGFARAPAKRGSKRKMRKRGASRATDQAVHRLTDDVTHARKRLLLKAQCGVGAKKAHRNVSDSSENGGGGGNRTPYYAHAS